MRGQPCFRLSRYADADRKAIGVNTLERIEQKLAVLAPDSVELIDDSDKHVGHEGAKGGGGHFQLVIVSQSFDGKSTAFTYLAASASVGELLEREIHALTIKAYTPDEI